VLGGAVAAGQPQSCARALTSGGSGAKSRSDPSPASETPPSANPPLVNPMRLVLTRIGRLRRRAEMQLAVGGWSKETVAAAGFVAEKDDYRPLRWVWRAFFVVGATLPTWSGESTVVFLAAFGLLGAWLVSAPQFVSGIADIDLAVLIPRVPALWTRLVGVAVKHNSGIPDLTKSDLLRLEAAAPALAKEAVAGAFLPKAANVSLAVAEGLGVALLGLLVGPILQHIHFGYWSPVSLLFGAVLPSVAMAISTLVTVVVGRAMLGSLAAGQRIEAAFAEIGELEADNAPPNAPEAAAGATDTEGVPPAE
jgi:hypothetical protein